MIEIHEESRLAQMRKALKAVEEPISLLSEAIDARRREFEAMGPMFGTGDILEADPMEADIHLRRERSLLAWINAAESRKYELTDAAADPRSILLACEQKVRKLVAKLENLEDEGLTLEMSPVRRKREVGETRGRLALWIGDPLEADESFESLIEIAEGTTLGWSNRVKLAEYHREVKEYHRRFNRGIERFEALARLEGR